MTASENEILDSPTPWVADHIRTYVETDGAEGHLYQGWPTLLLTTRGRRSGRLRRTPLIYGRAGDRYLLVASNAGAERHPAWYLNLTDTPAVSLQVGADHVTATARTATAEEKPRLWRIMTDMFPLYAKYQQDSPRELPLVILTPAPGTEGRTMSTRPALHDSERSADARKVAADFAAVLQRAGEGQDADLYDSAFAADVLWGSPFGASLTGYAELNAVHRRLMAASVAPPSRFEVVAALAPAPGVVVTQIRRQADDAGGFSEMALYVLVERAGRWWLAAAQNTPVGESPLRD